MNVVANNVDAVELFVNGVSKGKMTTPESGYLYAYPNIEFVPGTIKAVGYKGNKVVTTYELKTAGPPAAIKLTLHTAPGGMRADGDDMALIDFEVVDAKGERCPTDDARVDFSMDAVGANGAGLPAIWRGGYNSGKTNTTNNMYLNTEDGINRVAVRSTMAAGDDQGDGDAGGVEAGDGDVDVEAGRGGGWAVAGGSGDAGACGEVMKR